MEYKGLVMLKVEKGDNIIVVKEGDMLENVDNSFFVSNIQLRKSGEFKGRAFYLNSNYDWVIGKDDNGFLVLVPLRVK